MGSAALSARTTPLDWDDEARAPATPSPPDLSSPLLLAPAKTNNPAFSDPGVRSPPLAPHAPAALPAQPPSMSAPQPAPERPLQAAAPPSTQPPAAALQPAPGGLSAGDAAKGKTLYTFHAADLELQAALAVFARANNLNIVPDNDVAGRVTLDVRGLPLEQMMRALLEANDCAWLEEGGLMRVCNTQTRIFNVNYLRLSRKGIGQSSATLGSGSAMGGGGGGGGGASGGQGSSAFGSASSSITVTADNPVDFWKELVEEMGTMLTPAGKASLSVNKTAGIIQVTDRPSALKRVENYLKGVGRSIHRQIEIEARLYDVTLNDQFQFGIDWVHLAEAYGGSLGFGGATLPVANGGGQFADSALGGINRYGIVGSSASTSPGGNPATLAFQNFNTAAAVNAMQQQGTVEVISTPHIRTLNNQTALIKVGEEVPFFNTTTTLLPGTTAGTTTVQQNTVVSSITIGTILSITPQVSEDDWISLDISPVLTRLNQVVTLAGTGGASGGSGATAPDLDTKQESTLVRVRDGTTVVIGGLIQTQTARNDTKIPLLGDIPYLGKLFTGTFRFKQKKELVIFVTPHIVQDGESSQTMPKTLIK
jgi:MSHA type pilus biogenesis protein MshL